MVDAVRIPVTVKMRAGWNEHEINAPTLARMVEDAGAAAVAVHGRTAAQSYTGESDWQLIGQVVEAVSIPVLGSGDCIEPGQIVERMAESGVSGVLVGRGALRNPWIFSQAADARGGRSVVPTVIGRARRVPPGLHRSAAEGARRRGSRLPAFAPECRRRTPQARGRERWVINKLRALGSWYTKGLDGGGQLRVAINSAESIGQLRDIITAFFKPTSAEAVA